MTDKYNGLLIVFDEALREDDLQVYINAILLMKKVVSVKKTASNGVEYQLAKIQAQMEIAKDLKEVLYK